MIDLIKMTPEVYSEESRDFQLLCKIGDFVYNSVKYECDSIPNILDTNKIKGSFLPLLQTKLGFFSSSFMTDDELRMVLNIFPQLIKLKGSDLAIKYLLNACLKLYNISAQFNIEQVNGSATIGNIHLDNFSILVGINKVISISNIVQELMEYIMPPGYKIYIYFYTDFPLSTKAQYKDYIELLFTSDVINSNVRSMYSKAGQSFAIDAEDKLIGAIDTVRVVSNMDDTQNTSKFKGFYTSESKFPTIAGNFDFITDGRKSYTWYNSQWNEVTYKGHSTTLPSDCSPFTIVSMLNPQKYMYYRWDGSDWIPMYSKGSISPECVLEPKENDFINPSDGAKYFNGTDWVSLENDLGHVNSFPTQNVQVGDYCYLNAIKYYITTNGTNWEDFTESYFILEFFSTYYDHNGTLKDQLGYGLLGINRLDRPDVNMQINNMYLNYSIVDESYL